MIPGAPKDSGSESWRASLTAGSGLRSAIPRPRLAHRPQRGDRDEGEESLATRPPWSAKPARAFPYFETWSSEPDAPESACYLAWRPPFGLNRRAQPAAGHASCAFRRAREMAHELSRQRKGAIPTLPGPGPWTGLLWVGGCSRGRPWKCRKADGSARCARFSRSFAPPFHGPPAVRARRHNNPAHGPGHVFALPGVSAFGLSCGWSAVGLLAWRGLA